MSAPKNATVDANVAKLIADAVAAGKPVGTILQHPDEKGTLTNVVLAAKTTILLAKLDDGTFGYIIKFDDDSLSEPYAPAGAFLNVNNAKHTHDGKHLINGCWVDDKTPAGAKAIELQQNPFPGLANNDLYLTIFKNHYQEGGKVGTKVSNSVTCVQPKTLLELLPGATPPASPKSPKKGKKRSAPEETEEPEEIEETEEPEEIEETEEAEESPQPKKAKTVAPVPHVSITKIKQKGGAKIKASKRDLVYNQVLTHCSEAQLKKVLALYGYTHPAPVANGKQPNEEVTKSILRAQLCEFWGM